MAQLIEPKISINFLYFQVMFDYLELPRVAEDLFKSE